MLPIKILQPDWPAPSCILAGTTLRQGGISTGTGYSSLNLATHVGDNPEHAANNRQRLYQHLNLNKEPFWLEQQHTCHALNLDQPCHNLIADASYTTESHQTCVLLTADCLPILICNQRGTEIAAIHAGWRGLAADLISKTCLALQSDPKQLYIWLGPAISPRAYIVKQDFYDHFLQKDLAYTNAFSIAQTPNHYHASLYLIAHTQLIKLGIDSAQIYGGRWCTYHEASNFFSYRRDGAYSGRMASFISIRS